MPYRPLQSLVFEFRRAKQKNFGTRFKAVLVVLSNRKHVPTVCGRLRCALLHRKRRVCRWPTDGRGGRSRTRLPEATRKARDIGHKVSDGVGWFCVVLQERRRIKLFRISRVEATSKDQFASLESKLDKITKEVENIIWSVQFAQKDVRVLRGELQQFKNSSNDQLNSLGSSVTIIQSLLVEGHRQRQVYPANGESLHQTAAQEQKIYDSCDVASYNESKIERILPEPGFGEPFSVFCDQSYENGGWIVIQNRLNGSVDFYRGWKEYKNGFGNLNGEFWLGLDKLHALTYSAPYELHVLLEDFDNQTVVAKYSRFAVGNEHESYAITRLGNYTGSAGDGLSYHRGSKFSTMDVNHDVPGNNGGVDWTGAWWYRRGHNRYERTRSTIIR